MPPDFDSAAFCFGDVMDEHEKWKPVVGAEGRYEVSNLGRVRSLTRFVRCCHGAHRTVPSMILKPGRMSQFGHVSVALGKGNSRCVHTLVLEAFVGPRPKGFDACHKNGVGGDNRLVNLRWASRSDNNRDITRQGRRQLTLKQAGEILRRRKAGEVGRSLAKEFDVKENTICNIFKGRSYV